MLDALRTPLPPLRIALLSAALIAGTTLYCLAYTALAGRSESPLDGIVWSVVNMVPWLLAFEAGKRWGRPLFVVTGGTALSMLLGLAAGQFGEAGFELARRLPGALLVLALLIALGRRDARAVAEAAELPLPPARIAWVAAAGNYVELHGCGRPLLHRAPLSAVERRLAREGFVRIHRSTLVNRSRIARVRPTDVLLDDGRSLKLGARYRASLTA